MASISSVIATSEKSIIVTVQGESGRNYHVRVHRKGDPSNVFCGSERVSIKSDMDNEAFNKKFKEFFESIEGFGELLEYEGVYALKDAEQDLMEKLFNGGHIIKRSIGNIVDKKLIVDTGPLLGLDDLVIKINRHHRVATLQTEFFDKKIMVPLEVISKS